MQIYSSVTSGTRKIVPFSSFILFLNSCENTWNATKSLHAICSTTITKAKTKYFRNVLGAVFSQGQF